MNESAAVYTRRYPLVLLGAFAGAALLLAIVGIGGVISYTVTQRTREIGIRNALGAPRATILSMILRQGVVLAAIGVVIGVALALAGTRLLGSLLYAVPATDPATYGVVAAVMIGIALLASLAPAYRAARVDPAVTLRDEG